MLTADGVHRFIFRLFALVLTGLAGALFSPAARAQVNATLVAAGQSVQPGQPFTVALRLEHSSHWHSYWINPGTGYPTSLSWKLPPGWKAGDLQWPAPKVVRDTTGAVTGNGYEDVVYFPVTLTPPATLRAGETVTLAATAKWLMCSAVCVPGKAEVALTLPVADAPPAPDASHGPAIAAALAALPRDVPGLHLQATRNGAVVTLRLTAAADLASARPVNPWFFSSDAFIAFDQPQTVRAGAPNEWRIDLPVSPLLEKAPDHLVGVLRTEGSWAADGTPLPGLAVDVKIESAGTPAGPPSSSTGGGLQATVTRATAAGAIEVNSLAGTLALAFVGGLILNLMPCVFPVLGIKILGFVNQAGADRRKVTIHGLAFAAGVLASFWALAGALALLRAGGDQLGWGFQLQSPGFVFVLTAVMLVFALSMSGVFEFGLGATGVGAGLQQKHGYGGSFFTGVLATVVATPCSAPFLAPALGAALALPVPASFAVFTTIAVGLALPYLLLSIFPQAVRALPRPGAWMETFKQAMAFPLYATAGYLVWVLAAQQKDNDTGLLFILFGLTLIAMAAWLYGRYATFGAKPARARFGVIGGLLLLGLGAWLGWPRPPAPNGIVWREWTPELVGQLRAEGKPLYVDFTAKWCFTCQTNKKVVFGSSEVLKAFREKGVIAIRADWTTDDPRITAELSKWNRSAVPFTLVYLPDRPEPEVLPELLTPGVVLAALNRRP